MKDIVDILSIIYAVMFIIQIVLLVKSIRKKKKKYWASLFCIEIIPIMLSGFLIFYYGHLAPPNYNFMGDLGELIWCYGVTIVYGIMLCITLISASIVFEIEQKRNGKNSANPLILIFAFVLIMAGVVFLAKQVDENWGKIETTGIVVDFEEIRIRGSVEYCPVIEFSADGQDHQDSYWMENAEIGDTIKIYYVAYENDEGYKNYRIDTLSLVDYKRKWLPKIIIGLLLILFRATFFKLKDYVIRAKK